MSQVAFRSQFDASNPELTSAEFGALRDALLRITGIHLADSKKGLLEGRLRKRLSKLNLSSYEEYLDRISSDKDELQEFVNALTTNKTDFFRENDHFELLAKHIVPQIDRILPSDRPLSVWSAASSTGEEAYTLAMVLGEIPCLEARGFRILGTDIDTGVLKKAEAGIYSEATVRSQVADPYLRKNFEQGLGANAGSMRVVRSTRQAIKFRQFNLIESELPPGIKFDVIFLRNVLIYFEPSTIEEVIRRLSRYLAPHGFFFIGHSESLGTLNQPFTMVSSSVYTFPQNRIKL